MKHWFPTLAVTAALIGTARPEAPAPVVETWDAAYLNGAKAGHVHTLVKPLERSGKRTFLTTLELDLTVRRFNDSARMRMASGTEETPDGKVVAVSMTQFLGKEQQLVLHGTVQGSQLHVRVQGPTNHEKKIPWADDVVGLHREQQLFKHRGAKPGDRFDYRHYEPVINAVVTVRVTVGDPEEVDDQGKKRRLLRAVAAPDRIAGVQLPATTLWLDDDRQVVRSEVEMPGLGKLLLVRATREAALAAGTGAAKVPDIGLTNLVKLNRAIRWPHDSRGVVYRVTLPGDDDPATAFAADVRQTVKHVAGKSFELHVTAVREPKADSGRPAEAAEEFRKSNPFINSDDPKVRELARRAAGTETDPWKKARRIERWVRDNMRAVNFTEAMATADHVARTLEGDCSEFAMLTSAMCRAEGVPARVAVGFIYVDDRSRGPVLAYHMWSEVWVAGQWLTLDATLGRGSVGAAHLKIADHSWANVQSLEPMLPVMRVMLGKAAVEVLRVEGE